MKMMPRSAVHRIRWHQHPTFLVPVLREVGVESPVTGKVHVYQEVLQDEVQPLDRRLFAEDYSLEVQMKNGELNECPAFFRPSTPEEFTQLMQGASLFVQSQVDNYKAKDSKGKSNTHVEETEPAPEPASEPSKT